MRKNSFDSFSKILVRKIGDMFCVEWLYDRKVYPNGHISVENNFYSVPYSYVGQKVDVKLMVATLEIYHNDQCISQHRRFPKGISGKYDTRREDMPPYFNQPEMNGERMCQWADKIGPATRMVVDRIQEQAYNSVLSVMKLENKFSRIEIETACRKALEKFYSPRCHHLKAILSNTQSPGRVEAKIKSSGSSNKGLVLVHPIMEMTAMQSNDTCEKLKGIHVYTEETNMRNILSSYHLRPEENS